MARLPNLVDAPRLFVLQLLDVLGQLTRPSGRAAWHAEIRILSRVMRWALPWAVLGRISRDANPCRWLAKWAHERPDDVAVADPVQRVTVAELYVQCGSLAAMLARRGVKRGDRVAILLPTTTALVVSLLGCWILGAVPCPLDPDAPESLQSEIFQRLVPDWLVVSAGAATVGLIGEDRQFCPDGAETVEGPRQACIAGASTAMILPTSGSEGTVKLCRLSAGRLAFSGHAFGGLALKCRRDDVIYCPLPLHHATGITVALMPALIHGVTLHLGGKFSATRFWDDVRSSGATQLVYIGDLWRCALAATSADATPSHNLRVAVGNGLDASTWRAVMNLLRLPNIVEFYGATEAPSVLLNFSGRVGAVGRVPFRRISRWVLVRPEGDSDDSIAGRIRCGPGEIGELLIRVPRSSRPWLGNFEGYLEERDERRALVEHVFRPGDRYYRTHDLMRFDEDDYFYFVDRIGDVWRTMGHNVSTLWLASMLRNVAGVDDAFVVPVALDDSSRRFGLALVVTKTRDVIGSLETQLRTLPNYARPQLVQMVAELPRTSTWKASKAAWRSICWAPSGDAGSVYVWRNALQPIDVADWPAARAELLSG